VKLVIKIGSSTLTGKAGSALNVDAVNKLVDVVATIKSKGDEVVIVSSGAIAAGLAPIGLSSRPKDLASQQAAASVGQGLLIAKYNEALNRHNLIAAQVLLTIEDVVRRSHYQSAKRTLEKLLSLGAVPIINENDSVGTQEIKFGDNDRLSALVSHLIGADKLVLVSDIDALYDAPPQNPNAKRIAVVSNIAQLDQVDIGGAGDSGVGSGGMVTKIEAARIVTSAGIEMLLTNLDNLSGALSGKDVGTVFKVIDDRKPSRALWLEYASEPRGKLFLDAGAVRALIERGVSLLPAGVTKVEGTFSAGDTVELISTDGKVIAKGLVAFDSDEIPQLLGKSTKDLAATFGAEYERELVHRDDLVLLV
jgi:glutamate 5-kinase